MFVYVSTCYLQKISRIKSARDAQKTELFWYVQKMRTYAYMHALIPWNANRMSFHFSMKLVKPSTNPSSNVHNKQKRTECLAQKIQTFLTNKNMSESIEWHLSNDYHAMLCQFNIAEHVEDANVTKNLQHSISNSNIHKGFFFFD